MLLFLIASYQMHVFCEFTDEVRCMWNMLTISFRNPNHKRYMFSISDLVDKCTLTRSLDNPKSLAFSTHMPECWIVFKQFSYIRFSMEYVPNCLLTNISIKHFCSRVVFCIKYTPTHGFTLYISCVEHWKFH